MEDQTTVSVESDAAEVDRAPSPGARRKLDLLESLGLRGVAGPERSLEDIVRETSRNAQSRGLTEEVLRAFLRSR